MVRDNLRVHRVAGLAELVETRGPQPLYLPPYSPDFNPIELAFSKLKTWLRTAQARTRDALEEALRKATSGLPNQMPRTGSPIAAILYTEYETGRWSKAG